MQLIDYEKMAGRDNVVGGIVAHDSAEAAHAHMHLSDVHDVVSSA